LRPVRRLDFFWLGLREIQRDTARGFWHASLRNGLKLGKLLLPGRQIITGGGTRVDLIERKICLSIQSFPELGNGLETPVGIDDQTFVDHGIEPAGNRPSQDFRIDDGLTQAGLLLRLGGDVFIHMPGQLAA